MNVLRQFCPSCGTELDLPAESAGSACTCPTCQARFVVAALAEQSDQPPESGNPFSQPLGEGTVESVANPRGVPYTHPERSIERPIAATPVPATGPVRLEDIIAPAFAIFAARWPPLVFSALIVMFAVAAIILIPLVIVSNLRDAGSDFAADIVTFVCVPGGTFLICGLATGICRVTLTVVRNTSVSPMSDLVPPLSLLMRFLAGALPIGIALGSILYLMARLSTYLLSMVGSPALATLLGVGHSMMSAAIALLVCCLFWPWLMIASDNRASWNESLRISVALASHHKLLSLLIVLIGLLLAVVGTAICSIGHVVTAPLTLLMLAIGYLRLTGQELDDGTV